MENQGGATQHDREPGRPAPGAPTMAPRRRPRFSLLTLLLLMTIAAMGIVI